MTSTVTAGTEASEFRTFDIGINIQSCTFLHHITSLYVRDWIGCRLGREPEYWANSLGLASRRVYETYITQ